jgi:Protein of unknown function (DUF3147)
MRTYGVEVDVSGLRGTGWRDYALRFILGGGITAAAGLVAKECGPVIGGLFLAFPAIFPASATLIEKHEKQKKAKSGLDGRGRGIEAASVAAAGAAIGSLGLLLFAAAVWKLIDRCPPWAVLPGATLLWLAAAVGAWIARKRF